MFFLLLCLCRAVFIVVVDGTGVFPRNSFSFSNAVILAALWKRSNQMPKLLQQCSSVHSCFKNTRVHQAYKNRCMQLSVPSQEEPFISTILRSYCVNTWVQRCVLLFNQKACKNEIRSVSFGAFTSSLCVTQVCAHVSSELNPCDSRKSVSLVYYHYIPVTELSIQ